MDRSRVCAKSGSVGRLRSGHTVVFLPAPVQRGEGVDVEVKTLYSPRPLPRPGFDSLRDRFVRSPRAAMHPAHSLGWSNLFMADQLDGSEDPIHPGEGNA